MLSLLFILPFRFIPFPPKVLNFDSKKYSSTEGYNLSAIYLNSQADKPLLDLAVGKVITKRKPRSAQEVIKSNAALCADDRRLNSEAGRELRISSSSSDWNSAPLCQSFKNVIKTTVLNIRVWRICKNHISWTKQI